MIHQDRDDRWCCTSAATCQLTLTSAWQWFTFVVWQSIHCSVVPTLAPSVAKPALKSLSEHDKDTSYTPGRAIDVAGELAVGLPRVSQCKTGKGRGEQVLNLVFPVLKAKIWESHSFPLQTPHRLNIGKLSRLISQSIWSFPVEIWIEKKEKSFSSNENHWRQLKPLLPGRLAAIARHGLTLQYATPPFRFPPVNFFTSNHSPPKLNLRE